MQQSKNTMIASISNTNQAIRANFPEKPDPKMELNHERRHCIEKKHQQQDSLHDNHPKRRDSLHATNSKIDSENKKGDKIENDETEEERLKRATELLRPYDVICGRGSIPFNNIGNRRFRILISMNVRRYNECDGRNRKGLYIRSLVRTFEQEVGIRFLKLKNGRLVQLTSRQIRQKVGHALRDVLAFQESQLQLEKEREEQAKTKRMSVVAPTKKPEPCVLGPTTAIPRSNEALSSVRSRINTERSDGSTIWFQNRDFPSPIPPPYPRNLGSSARTPRQDSSNALGFHYCAGNQDTQQHASSLQASTNLSQRPNCFLVSATIQHQHHHQHCLGPSSVSAVPREQNFQTERDSRHFQRREDNSLALHNFTSNHERRNIEKAQDRCDSNNKYINNNFHYRCNDESDDSFDNDDFVPLPIDHPEQGDDMIDMFGC